AGRRAARTARGLRGGGNRLRCRSSPCAEYSHTSCRRSGAPPLSANVLRVSPASPAQELFWLAAQAAVRPEAYNLAAAIYLNGPLDHGLLRRAIQQLLDAQPALRTTLRLEPA